jgi:beta-glucanase (GH16 family)
MIMALRRYPVLCLLAAAGALIGGAPGPQPVSNGKATAEDWILVWSDEFDSPKLDRRKWDFDVDCWGGGNEEQQCYRDGMHNVSLEDGKLVITARRKQSTGAAWPKHMRGSVQWPNALATKAFTSARLSTKGKAAWRYGRLEIRARLPQGQGTWPAIWMLPAKDRYGSWAASGEIDILEAVNLGVPCATCPGGRESTILGTLHFGGIWPKNLHKGDESSFPEVLDGGFHTYSLEWYPERMVWKVDGKIHAERLASEWSSTGSKAPGAPFDQPFHLILNLAIGGKLAETRGLGGVALDGYPKRMEVDWVRVWQRPGERAGPQELGGK